MSWTDKYIMIMIQMITMHESYEIFFFFIDIHNVSFKLEYAISFNVRKICFGFNIFQKIFFFSFFFFFLR